MATIYLPFAGNQNGGGPHIFVHKFSQIIKKRGHQLIFDKPQRADIALGIIESGKLLRQVNRTKTKVFVRIDNAYFKGYWDGSPGREWRGDMTALHKAIERDFNDKSGVDHVIFQSEFSKNLICAEIARRDKNFSIIHNGVDTSVFAKKKIDKQMEASIVKATGVTDFFKKTDGKIKIIHHAKMRNDYIMESLLGTTAELKNRGHDVVLIIAGNMDAECANIYKTHKSKDWVFYLGPFANNRIPEILSLGDVYLAPRQGSSCDNCVVEALSMTLPVVLPRWGGNSELITDGVEGSIVENGGQWNYGNDYINKLADGVERILPDLDAFKQRARQHAVANLTVERMVDRYLKAMGL